MLQSKLGGPPHIRGYAPCASEESLRMLWYRNIAGPVSHYDKCGSPVKHQERLQPPFVMSASRYKSLMSIRFHGMLPLPWSYAASKIGLYGVPKFNQGKLASRVSSDVDLTVFSSKP